MIGYNDALLQRRKVYKDCEKNHLDIFYVYIGK